MDRFLCKLSIFFASLALTTSVAWAQAQASSPEASATDTSASTPKADAPAAPAEESLAAPVKSAEIVLPAPDVKLIASVPADQGPLLTDKLMHQAHSAYKDKNIEALEKLVPQLSEHPLGDYAQYWLLHLQAQASMQQKAKDGSLIDDVLPLSLEMSARFARFVSEHDGQYLAERARTDWARLAARASDANTFLSLYTQLQWNQNEADLLCWKSFFDLRTHDSPSVRQQAKARLLALRTPTIEAGHKLASELLTREPNWAWTYALILMQKKYFTLTRKLIERTAIHLLPVPREELLSILAKPRNWYDRNKTNLETLSGKLLTFAALRLATVNTVLAANVAQAAQGKLPEQEQAMVWGRIGYIASVDLDPAALSYYAKAGAALNDAHRASFTYDGDQLQLWRARAALRTNDAQTLLAAIDAMTDRWAQTPAWIYWKGRALQQLDQPEQAQALLQQLVHRTDFYGLLACDALNVPYHKGQETLTPPVSPQSLEIFAAHPSLNRALRFYALELFAEGHREWNWAMRDMGPRERSELAEYAGILGISHRQIFTSMRLDKVIFSQRFPMPHRKEIELAAATAGLPASWLFAVIHQESRFIRFAKSSAGALGLMQVMPRTARWVAKKIALQNYIDGQLSRMETNLAIGSQYLKLVSDSVQGNIIMATASYNAGPKKAQTWRALLTQPVEAAIFAETIPYGETRDYVMTVAANCVQYSRYTDHPLRLTDFIGRISPQQVDVNILP